ncbi:hypothetical protein AAMO2058_000865000 [Amorphochlora amoebiformis]
MPTDRYLSACRFRRQISSTMVGPPNRLLGALLLLLAGARRITRRHGAANHRASIMRHRRTSQFPISLRGGWGMESGWMGPWVRNEAMRNVSVPSKRVAEVPSWQRYPRFKASRDMLTTAAQQLRAVASGARDARLSLWESVKGIIPKTAIEASERCMDGMRLGMGITSLALLANIQAPGSWLTRILLLRSVALVYFVAFMVAKDQNKALIGDTGLLPAKHYLSSIKDYFRNKRRKFSELLVKVPTLLWFERVFPWNKMNRNLDILAWSGMILSAFVFVRGGANVPIMAALFVLYHSINSVGQDWYSFGWESQLLETGFLAMFLVPYISTDPLPSFPSPWVVLAGMQWLMFRIMLGSGLIKMRGDSCWRTLTAMNYHYETQPVPNPLSRTYHQLPKRYHYFETLMNHVTELVLPFMMLYPNAMVRGIGGLLQIVFQAVLISSGNLSFLNWLTMIPAMACFDDKFLAPIFPKYTVDTATSLQTAYSSQQLSLPWATRQGTYAILGMILAKYSLPVIQNLMSTRQAMNQNVAPLCILGTYGAFGSVTKKRYEIIIKGTDSNSSSAPESEWREYHFKAKPGKVDRRPPLFSPYHYRLDWLMWFAAMHNSYQEASYMRDYAWFAPLLMKLLQNNKQVTGLLMENPFKEKPPKYIRADRYRYKYAPKGTKGKTWVREYENEYFPPICLSDFKSQRGSSSGDGDSSVGGVEGLESESIDD